MKTKRLVAIGIKKAGEKRFTVKSVHNCIFNGKEFGQAIIESKHDGEMWNSTIKTVENSLKPVINYSNLINGTPTR